MHKFYIPGQPRPQGSLQLYGVTRGRPRLGHSKTTRAHRQALVDSIESSWTGEPLTGPVKVFVRFGLARPDSHLGTGRNRSRIKANAPRYHVTTPDVDKLLRLVLDGLTYAGVIEDDKQVVFATGEKFYVPRGSECTLVEVETVG